LKKENRHPEEFHSIEQSVRKSKLRFAGYQRKDRKGMQFLKYVEELKETSKEDVKN
jgi:3-deoxy-D-manno-octulosonic-acid transferase